ncbi:MAG TPA: hypothetical protein VGC79_24545, partial [Polyangiaceae bacterium]
MSAGVSLLDRPPTPSGKPLLASLGAVCVHAALIGTATFVGAGIAREVSRPALVSQIVEIEMPPPAPVLVPEPPAEPSRPLLPRTVATREPPHEAPAPPAAQAGQVLAAADDVVDFGDSFVVGKGESYAGGTTDANGTAAHPVQEPQARGAGASPTKTALIEVDHSRAPRLAGGSSWDCPFPVEADDAGLQHALVTLRIEVAADGHVLQASATRDPGHGFGREARRCALGKRWAPGLDHD